MRIGVTLPLSNGDRVGIRLHEPGSGTSDDVTGLDADAAGLADFLDELASLGFDDAVIWSIPKSATAVDRIAEARRVHLA